MPAIEVRAGRLRHVIAPFLIQARQFFEFFPEILIGRGLGIALLIGA
jgi:hypothetical protein